MDYFSFLLLEEELDVHVSYDFFDHVEQLALRIHSPDYYLFHFLPILLQIDFEYFWKSCIIITSYFST